MLTTAGDGRPVTRSIILSTHPRSSPFSIQLRGVPSAEGAEPPVGWFPLAPGDAYGPWFAASPAYVESVNVVYPRRFHEDPLRWREERGREVWHEEFANRRFATFVHRDVFAHGRAVDREMMRIPAERLERAMVMRGAPRVMPAVMRTMAGPGGPRSEPHGMPPGTVGPGGPHEVAPAMASRARAARFLEWRERVGCGTNRMRRPLPGHARLRQRVRAREVSPDRVLRRSQLRWGAAVSRVPQQYGRPEVFHTPAPTYRRGRPDNTGGRK